MALCRLGKRVRFVTAAGLVTQLEDAHQEHRLDHMLTQLDRVDVLIVDEAHNCAPSGRGKYATDSLRTGAIRLLAPHFEHKLFLTATPHNGYSESFTALLELLDN